MLQMAKTDKRAGGGSRPAVEPGQWKALGILFAGLVALAWLGWLVLEVLYEGIGLVGVTVLCGACGTALLTWRWRAEAPQRADRARVEAARQARTEGDFGKAEQALVQLLREKIEGGRPAGRAGIHWELASLYRQMRRWDEAAGQAKAAMAASEGQAGEEEQVIAGVGPSFLIEMLTRLERWGELEEFARERLAKARGKLAVDLRLETAAALQRQGKTQESVAHLREAVTAARACDQGRQEVMARSLQALGAVGLELNDMALAGEAFDDLRKVAADFPEGDQEQRKWNLLGAVGLAQVWVAEGNAGAAGALLHDAVEAAGDHVSEEIRAKSLYLLAGALLAAGHFMPARRRAKQALALWQSAGDDQARMANQLIDSITLQETLSGAGDSTGSSREE